MGLLDINGRQLGPGPRWIDHIHGGAWVPVMWYIYSTDMILVCFYGKFFFLLLAGGAVGGSFWFLGGGLILGLVFLRSGCWGGGRV